MRILPATSPSMLPAPCTRMFPAFVAVGLAINPGHSAHAQQDRSGTMAGRSTVYAPNGVVASSQPLATGAGLAVLQSGGNAIDAAVTTAAMLNVVEPMMTGIGGDMFAIVWLADEQRMVGLNASGRAGTLMTRETLVARGHEQMPRSGAETITVPGALAGWQTLLDSYGTISLAKALQPAIEMAEHGFPASPVIVDFWEGAEEMLRRDEGARNTFLVDGERAPRPGEWFGNPDFARTLRLIAEKGPDVLYRGELGEAIVQRAAELGGFLTMDDLRSHSADWVEPISVPYRGYRLHELPPNGQGIAALEILRLLEPFDLKAMGHNSTAYLHHLIEAKKLAYADLGHFVGDPGNMRVTPDDLLSDEFIDARRALLDPERAIERADPGTAITASETTYFTVADRHGNMVSFINSIASAFGSGVVVPGTGFALQNRGVGFSLDPDRANAVAPGRRPFHTIIPAFVTKTADDGREEPWLSYGVMGGAMQPQGHVQVLINLVDFGMDLQQALDAARFNHLSGNRVAIEPVVPPEVRKQLEAMGHVLADPTGVFFGGGQAIMRLERGWAAASEPRMDGMAAGH